MIIQRMKDMETEEQLLIKDIKKHTDELYLVINELKDERDQLREENKLLKSQLGGNND